MNRISWKGMIVGTLGGLSVITSPVVGQAKHSIENAQVRLDNRSHGLLNSGVGSLQSGRHEGDHEWRDAKNDLVVAQANDVRQEDRRADRQMDRREDRREDRQLDRREERREDRQMDRREDRQMDRREDRQADRREDHRSNAGGELRGLDRANHVAGERGRDGRDNARTMQMERPERPDHQDRPDRAERPERGERH